jgi:hypothetical protein
MDRIADLEDELRQRDRRIAELKDELERERNLTQEMIDQVERSNETFEAWKHCFEMVLNEEGMWIWDPSDQRQSVIDGMPA